MDRLAFRFHNELIEKMHIAKKRMPLQSNKI